MNCLCINLTPLKVPFEIYLTSVNTSEALLYSTQSWLFWCDLQVQKTPDKKFVHILNYTDLRVAKVSNYNAAIHLHQI